MADFDNDSRLDLVVTNSITSNISILFGNGDGTFGIQITYTTGVYSQPFSVAVGDFNSDNQLDIAVVNYGGSTVG